MTTATEKYVAEAMAKFLSSTKGGDFIEAAPTVMHVEPDPVPAPKEVPLAEGMRLFSSIFGYVPKNGDFGVSTYKVSEYMEGCVPHADASYVVQQDEAARLVAAIEDEDKVLMTGPTGSGKSSLVKYVCAKLDLPFIRVNMSADVESAQLFGSLVVRDGATVWEDGPITEAVRHGAVLLIDEWELMPPEISMGLQNLLEDGGYLYLKEMPGTTMDKTLLPHPNFRIVCAGNTVGQGDESGGFAGTFVQNTATLDRFTTTICLDYLSAEHEVSILTGKGGAAATAKKMVQFAALVRSAHASNSINLTMSPRTLINWVKKAERYGVEHGLQVAFIDKLRESDKAVVKELYNKVF